MTMRSVGQSRIDDLTRLFTAILGTRWNSSGDIGTDIAAIIAAIGGSKTVGVCQIVPKTIDLNQAAGTYTVFTGTTQDCLVKNLIFRVPAGAIGGAVTSISIQTDDATPTVLINSALGAVANLTSEVCLSWPSLGEAFLLKVGKHIQLTINGGAAGVAKVCDVVVEYEAATSGGYLA